MKTLVINGPLEPGAVVASVIVPNSDPAKHAAYVALLEGQGKTVVQAEAHSGWVYDGEDWAPPPVPAPTPVDVDAERDRRIEAGFTFGGKAYQSRDQDRENIAGASVAALAAMMNGAQPDDLRWHGGASDFVWIAEDNSLTPMDAQTMFAFGQAAMAHKQSMIFAARAIKDADPIPAEYADDGYWP